MKEQTVVYAPQPDQAGSPPEPTKSSPNVRRAPRAARLGGKMKVES